MFIKTYNIVVQITHEGWASVMTNQKKSIKSAKQKNQKPSQNSSKKSSRNNGIDDDTNINSGG
ncbi:hypothetical protein D3C73_531090 [compost metagenome]